MSKDYTRGRYRKEFQDYLFVECFLNNISLHTVNKELSNYKCSLKTIHVDKMSDDIIAVLKKYLGKDIIDNIDYKSFDKRITDHLLTSSPQYRDIDVEKNEYDDSKRIIHFPYVFGNYTLIVDIGYPKEKITLPGIKNYEKWDIKDTSYHIEYKINEVYKTKRTRKIRISSDLFESISKFIVDNSNIKSYINERKKSGLYDDIAIHFYNYVSNYNNQINKTVIKDMIYREVTVSFNYKGCKYRYMKGKNVFDGRHGLLVVKSEYMEKEYKDEKCELYAKAINDREIHKKELGKRKKSSKNQTEKKIKSSDFLVRSNFYGCIVKNHSLKDINAVVKVAGSKETYEISVPASYCDECEKYYILEDYYRELKSYGYICCRVVEIIDLQNNSTTLDFKGFKDQSLLNSYGYNVSKTKGLSKELRQYILQNIVNNGIMKKEEVISFINKLIQINKNKDNFKSAINKWQEDVKYVSSLQNNPKNVNVKKIIIKTKS